MHSEVQEKVGLVQIRTAKLVQDQEQELLRAFKQRLSDVQAELETEKMGSSKEGGVVAWMDKSKAFEIKADQERERADKEDRIFTGRAKEKEMLEVNLKLQKDDRDQLIKQLVTVKKHNTALRSSLAEYGEEKASLEAALKDAPVPHSQSIKHTIPNQTFPPDADKMPRAIAETRYNEVLKSLTRMLASERKAETVTVTALEEHTQSLSDLEIALRACVDQVRQSTANGQREPHGSIDSFGVEDREKALEMWLTKDGVIDHLCAPSTSDSTSFYSRSNIGTNEGEFFERGSGILPPI